jgi:hypothetical protein
MKLRKNYFIYPKFQTVFLLLNILINALFFTFIFARTDQFFARMSESGVSEGLAKNHPYFQFIDSQRSYLLDEFFFSFIICTIISSIISLVLSHRLAGPFVRLTKFLKRVSEGEEYKNFKFRQHDYFQDLPEYLNKIFEKNKLK